MPEWVLDKNCFTRYDMYKFFLKETPEFKGEDRVCSFNEYYRLESYFAKLYACDCTDCGGGDVSRKCGVEWEFSKHYGSIHTHNIV